MKSIIVNNLKLNDPSYPTVLKTIPSPPRELFWLGNHPETWLDKPRVAVVGSRKVSPYGRQMTQQIVSQLAGFGVVIISGLAYGVDAVAHQAALDSSGLTVAVLPTDLQRIYPASNQNLAQNIISSGGSLLSEYPSGSDIYKENFVARNRIVSGLADVLLITEAAVNSGSLHTARFALDQGKTVMAVPGNVTSVTSEGCNNLIKSGAIPATSVEDVLFALGITPKKARETKVFRGSPQEEAILGLIRQGISGQEQLAIASQLEAPVISGMLTTLEIGGHIRPAGNGNWVVS